jgi:hypothetical protein
MNPRTIVDQPIDRCHAGGAPELLSVMLEGESLLNDASSLTLFAIFKEVALLREHKVWGQDVYLGLSYSTAHLAAQLASWFLLAVPCLLFTCRHIGPATGSLLLLRFVGCVALGAQARVDRAARVMRQRQARQNFSALPILSLQRKQPSLHVGRCMHRRIQAATACE